MHVPFLGLNVFGLPYFDKYISKNVVAENMTLASRGEGEGERERERGLGNWR